MSDGCPLNEASSTGMMFTDDVSFGVFGYFVDLGARGFGTGDRTVGWGHAIADNFFVSVTYYIGLVGFDSGAIIS